MNEPLPTIQAWLAQQTGRDIPLHHLARALGVSPAVAADLLKTAPTAEALLNLNRLAQYRHLPLANRVWPHCTWLDWENRQGQLHPTIDLILNTFGHCLLDEVERIFGREVVFQYWSDLDIPSLYRDIELDDEADPLSDIPQKQLVWNPHLVDDEVDELFIFGSPETAACFRWLIESRFNYSYYVDIRTGYHNDPLGIRLAYDLRRKLKEEYWATLPPDTLPAYLAVARALQQATVPEVYQEGRLAPLQIVEECVLPTSCLEIVQMDEEKLWLVEEDALVFDGQPIHVFVLEADTDQSPVALILTTRSEPGNPEQHRQGEPLRYLQDSPETMVLALVPKQEVDQEEFDLGAVEDIILETLFNTDYGLHAETGTFCLCRINPFFGEVAGDPIPVYRIPGGYMLQFNPEYQFIPQEMAVE